MKRVDVIDVKPGQLWRFQSDGGHWAVFLVTETHDTHTVGLTVALSEHWRRFSDTQTRVGLSRDWSLGRARSLSYESPCADINGWRFELIA